MPGKSSCSAVAIVCQCSPKCAAVAVACVQSTEAQAGVRVQNTGANVQNTEWVQSMMGDGQITGAEYIVLKL